MASKKNKPTGFNLAGSSGKYGFRTVPNESVPWRLQSADGTYFGDVSYGAYKAVEGGTLDSYQAKNDAEKNAIAEFRKHPGITLKAQDGTEIGKISYDAYRAFTDNKIESYTPHSDAEKNVISNFKSYLEGVAKEERINSNPVFKRYNIDPADFDYDDLIKWAGEHNHTMRVDGSMRTYFTPNYKGGFLGIGGKKLSTDQEDEDMEVLYQLAQNNTRYQLSQQDLGALMSGIVGMGDGISFGAISKLSDWSAKKQYEDAGLDSETFVSPTQTWANTVSEHKISNIVGDIGGSLITFKAAGTLVEAGLMKIPKYASLATEAANGVKKAQKAKNLIDTAATVSSTTAIGSAIQQDWKNTEWYKSVGNVLLDTTVSTLGAYVGGKLSSVVGERLGYVLQNKTNLSAAAIKGLVSGTNALTFSGTAVGLSEMKNALQAAANNTEYKPDVESIVTNMAVLAIYSGLKSYVDTKRLSGGTPVVEEKFEYFTEEDMSSPDALKKKMRQYTKEYHPDKFHGAGEEAVANATQKMQAINAEYERAKNKVAFNIMSEMQKAQSDDTSSAKTTSEKAKATNTAVAKAVEFLNDAYATDSTTASVASSQTMTKANVTPTPTDNVGVGATMPPVVAEATPAVKNTNDFTDELSEVASAGAVAKYAPESASADVVSLENKLINVGASDVDRQKVVETAIAVESTLVGTDKSLKDVLADTTNITGSAVTAFKQSVGAPKNYWSLFNTNLKTIAALQPKENFIADYANTFAETLQSTDSVMSRAVVDSGIDVASAVSQYALMGNVPEEVKNETVLSGLSKAFTAITDPVLNQIDTAHIAIYGDARTQEPTPEMPAETQTAPTEVQPATTNALPQKKRNVSLSQVGDFYEAYGEDATALAEQLDLTPTTKTVNGVSVPVVNFPVSSLTDYQQKTGYEFSVASIMERNPLSNQEKKVFSYDKDGKIRFKQKDINYENSKYRDDTFNVMVQGKGEIETLQGGIVGKYGVHGKNNGYIGVTLLSSGMDIAAFKTDEEAIAFATYANRTIPFNDVSYVRNGEGVLTIDATPEFMQYGEHIKALKESKAYVQVVADATTSTETVISTDVDSEENAKTDVSVAVDDGVVTTDNAVVLDSTPALTAEVAESTKTEVGASEAVADDKVVAEKKKSVKTKNKSKTTLTKSDISYLATGEDKTYSAVIDGKPFVSNGFGIFAVDNQTLNAINEQTDSVDATRSDMLAKAVNKTVSGEYVADVEEHKEEVRYKRDKNTNEILTHKKTGKELVAEKAIVCLIDETPVVYNARSFDILNKISTSLKAYGQMPLPTLVGFDADGNFTGMVLPKRSTDGQRVLGPFPGYEIHSVVDFDGKLYVYGSKGEVVEKKTNGAIQYAPKNSSNNKAVEKENSKPDTEPKKADLKKGVKSDTIKTDEKIAPEDATPKNLLSDYTKDMKPMQKGKVEKTLNSIYKTKEYGALTYAEFMERNISDGKQLTVRRDLKPKVRNEHNEFSYSKGLEASYNKHIANYRSKGINRFDLTIEAKDLKDGVGAGKNIKAVDPELYYHLTGDESALPENSYDKTYCVMQDGNTFYSVPKTAYDYGLWLQKQADTDEASFSLENVIEEEKDLIAIHNISPEKLKSTIELGGLPMPSIAVTRANELFSKFGTISILFNKDTIDPKNKRNKVYSGDAYTPTFPQIDYRASNDVLKQVRDKVYSLVGGSSVADELDHLHLDTDNVQHTLGRYDGDVVQGFADNATLKYAFLKDRKVDVNLPTKEKPLYRYGEVPNRDVVAFAHRLTNGLQSANELLGLNSRDLMANTELKDAIAQVLNDGVVANVDKNSDRYQALLDNPLYKADELDLSTVLGMLEAAQRYFSGGSQLTTTIDSHNATKMLNEYLKSNNLESDYHAWIRQLFDGVVAQKGIRNNLDTFTPSGNRRSFNALHHELNLENVVKAMRSGAKQGISVFGGSIFGGSTIPYGSIAEIKNNKNRLKAIDAETYDNQRKEFSDRFYDIARKYVIHSDGVWGAQEVLVEAVVKCKTKDGLKTYLQREGKGWARNFDEVTTDLISLVNDIRQMPTEYFEAKPERVVGFDEIVAFVVPDNLDADLRSSIEDLGAEVVTYDHTDKSGNSRFDAINSVEDVKFSTENRKGVSNDEKGRSDTLSRSVGWGVSKSAGKSSRGVSETASGIEESSRQGTDTESSRRIYAENVRAVQGTEVRQQGPFQCEFINPEHYTDEMKAIEQTNKERGIKNTYFFFGDGKVAFKNKVIFRGAIAKGDIYIRCDHPKYSPAQINRHEYVHHKYKTEDVTKVRNYINKHLTNAEKEHIINVMYARYALVCKGDVDLIFQEFVCDVLADMNDYGVVFKDIADAYWSDNTDLIDSYTAADYAESIDAGGVAFSSKEYADTFYSQMAKVIDAIKQEKIGAASVVSYLKGRGVKDEEIKWSGIEDWLSGKKSVTKAELQEFVAGSMLQIEEQELGETIKYTDEQKARLDSIEAETHKMWDEVHELWGKLFVGEDIYDLILTYNNTYYLAQKIEKMLDKKGLLGTAEGSRLLQLVQDINMMEIMVDDIVKSAKENGQLAKWSDYKLDGGENYREITFKMPNSTYANQAMRTHWGYGAEGVIAHARIQDFLTDGKKMLFIEEIQSDWHNEGNSRGYESKLSPNEQKTVMDLNDKRTQKFNELSDVLEEIRITAENAEKQNLDAHQQVELTASLWEKAHKLRDEERALKAEVEKIEGTGNVPDAPFRSTYHEFVLKNLLRIAAEQGYDTIGWTTGKTQEERWSSNYAEAYRIEYDQEIPKFLNKYGKKWGAKVGRAQIGKVDGGWYEVDGTAIWAMPITDDMRESVLYEGQPIYSLADKNTYDHTKPFSEQLDDWAKGLVPQNDSLTVGATPKVLQQIGFNPLPVTINQEHIDYAVNGTKDTDHYISKNVLAQLPQALEAPVAVIRSQSTPTRVVAILSLTNPQNGKQVIVPFEIDGSGRQNNIRIDTNAITTIFGKSNALVQMKNAIETDSNNDNKLFYWNKKEAVSLLQRAGLQLSGGLPQDGFIHSIRDKGSKVKWKFNNVTETQQFKRWFGKSKIVNADGTPKVMYHGSDATFSVFDVNKAKASGYYGKGFYFTDSESHASTYGKLYPAYLSVQTPLEYGKNKISKNQTIAFLEAVAENEDYSIENYGTYDISEIMSRITSTDAFSVIQDVNATAIGDMVEAVKLFNSINSTKFDGIITPTETIVFEPTQIKSATDNIGTFDSENPDIYYSLDEDGEPDLFDIWKSKVDEFGAIPKGENPARDIDVPEKIDKDKLVSRFARTMLEAGITPDTAVSEFEKRVLDGTMTHEVVTNDAAREWAVNQIKYHGFEEALNSWEVYTRDGNVGKKELALGMELYNQCITNGDVTNAMKIAAELVAEATHAGQTLQATRMLKLMTPDGQLYYLEKSIQKMNEEFKKKIGDKYEDIELNEDLMEKFLTEKDADKRDEIYDDICQNIADQIPATLLDKWNSWRYLAMLGNARTHIRNIAGNAVFVPAIKLKNYIGAAIETAAKVDTEKRTKSLRKNKDAVDFAKKDFRKMQKVLQGENAKYAVTSDIEGKRTIFKTKWLESLRNKNFEWLEKEDMWFLEKHYVDALAQIITARKLDVNNIDEKTLDIARAYAVREAQRATYRDANSLAEALNKLQKKAEHSDKKAIRATNLLIEGVMPFKKTPLNIAKQGVQYSPIGILSGIYKIADKVKGGKAYSTTDIIDDFAKGLTGTAIMLLGTLLASLGIISGGADDNKKKKEFDKMVGEQAFSLNIGDSSYTIDWMTPACLPLFTGVELYELTKDDFKFADIVTALSSLTDPLLELSVFSGISGAIESAQYNDTNTLYAIGSDMTTSYLTQALPTIGGQLSRIIDKNKREYYYTDKNSNLPKGLQNIMGQAASKIPFASYLFEPAIDEWGREETYGNLFERAVENAVSPGYYAEKNYTAVDNEIKRLYESTGDASVLPVIQQKKYTEDKVDYPMTAEQYTEAKRIRGQKSFTLINNLIKSNKYKSMSDVEKAAAIAKCYREAGEYAKEQMINKVKRNK